MICDPAPSDAQPGRSQDSESAEKGTTRVALGLFLLGATLLLGAGAVWGVFEAHRALFKENPAYRVNTVDVTNNIGLVSRDDVLRQLELSDKDLAKGINLYAIDLAQQRRAFLLDHPDIRDFSLQRFPPDRILIDLQERFPVAQIGHRGLAVDDDGFVFKVSKSREHLFENLPSLISEDFADIQPGARIPGTAFKALDVLRAMRRQNAPLPYDIEEIDLTGEIYLDLLTENNVLIRLPEESLASVRDITRSLRLAGAPISAGNVPPGRTLVVQPGEAGKESRVILK